MNAKEMRKVIEEKLINTQKAFREQLKLYGDDNLTMNLAHASCALSELYEDLFGREEFDKLMEKNFPEIFKD
jgi:hypothetical protein